MLTTILLAFSISEANAADAAAGQALFPACTACHGAKGEGNPAKNAPVIGGQEAWYLERQLHAFRAGVRGTDAIGAAMTPMAKQLADDTAVANVAAYVATLSPPQAPHSVTGDAAKGQVIYTLCASCHGAAGEGNLTMNAPALWRQQDTYIVRQLTAFKAGGRGADPTRDVTGSTMAAIAQTLTDEAAIRDVAAYIGTLKH